MKKLLSVLCMTAFLATFAFTSGAFSNDQLIAGVADTPAEATELVSMDEDGRDVVVTTTTTTVTVNDEVQIEIEIIEIIIIY